MRPGPLRVGPLSLYPPLLQAPMSSLTNLPMRTLAEEHGCPFTVTEWLPAAALAARNATAVDRLRPSRADRPFGVQLFGRDPRALARAARMAAAAGASLVDLNLGCPGKRVRSGSCGAALMREPQLACELVRAVREGVGANAAVSVKLRTGWDERSKNAPELAVSLAAAGAQLVTVHGRTRQQRYAGAVDLQTIAAVKAAVEVPVVANGDIVDRSSMARAFAETGADGVMIGRAALGNPWIFGELRSWWGEPAPPAPGPRERLAAYLRHLELYLEIAPEPRAVIEMRKFARWYLAPVPGGEALRAQINRIERAEAIRELLAAAAAG